jgi:beta-lactamase class A
MHSSQRPRRRLAAVPLALAAALLGACSSSPAASPVTAPAASLPSSQPRSSAAADSAFGQLESRYHARLGVYAVDPGTGQTVTHRPGERFAFTSTAKALAAGVLLQRETDAQLDRTVTYSRADLLSYAPVTSQHVGTGMPLRDLMTAALQNSDNTAANLLLAQLGGPQSLQNALRALGDTTTHVDRTEPDLNTATPGDARDTTTPQAIGTDLRRLVLGDALPPARRQLLTTWLIGNTTGGPYVRAGVPAGWIVGDKTGNGGYGTRNDIAVAWRADGRPLVIALLSDRGTAGAASDDALLADATRTALRFLP